VPGGRLLMRWVLRRAATLTAVSSPLAAAAAQITGRAATEIAVEPMPLASAAPAAQAPRREGAVFVGRLTAQKHVADLLEALALLGRRGAAGPCWQAGGAAYNVAGAIV
jgi:glycosyltransferase involved in cell wall biosynthesis